MRICAGADVKANGALIWNYLITVAYAHVSPQLEKVKQWLADHSESIQAYDDQATRQLVERVTVMSKDTVPLQLSSFILLLSPNWFHVHKCTEQIIKKPFYWFIWCCFQITELQKCFFKIIS